MLCVRCQKVSSFEHFTNFNTGKLNKTCRCCLGNTPSTPAKRVIVLKSFCDMNFSDLFPETILVVTESEDLETLDLKDIFNDLNTECIEQTGYNFRVIQTTEDHIYSKCRYSDKIQTRDVVERKRKNFGKEKFNCDGLLNIHRNSHYISILFKHIAHHQKYLDTSVNGEILVQIKEKARLLTPSQIYKQLLSTHHDNDQIRNITISQIRYFEF